MNIRPYRKSVRAFAQVLYRGTVLQMLTVRLMYYSILKLRNIFPLLQRQKPGFSTKDSI